MQADPFTATRVCCFNKSWNLRYNTPHPFLTYYGHDLRTPNERTLSVIAEIEPRISCFADRTNLGREIRKGLAGEGSALMSARVRARASASAVAWHWQWKGKSAFMDFRSLAGCSPSLCRSAEKEISISSPMAQ